MIRLKLPFLICAVCFFSCLTLFADVYVSPFGDDSNDGSIAKPFKTLVKAFDAVKGKAVGQKIWMREGIYDQSSTILLSALHSGSSQEPLIISAYQGEKVIINGGKRIPNDKFTLVSDAFGLQRLPVAARGNVYAAKLYESEYTSLFPSMEKYNVSALISWNGYTLQEAQYPNRGYAYISSVVDKGPATRWLLPGESPMAYSESNPTGGKIYLRDALDWSMMKTEFDRTHDMQLRGYLAVDWLFESERIGKINANGLVQLLRYTVYGIDASLPLPRRIKIIGALCQLDEPGEWYYDKALNVFYIWPVQQFSEDKPVVIGGRNILIDSSEKIENIEFRNLIFENFADHGIRLMNANNIKVLGCEFRSGNGICLRLQGENNLVKSSDFHDADRAMLVGGITENITNQKSENNAVINNHIHHLWLKGYGAYMVSGVGARFANNLMHDMNGALGYGNNDCIVEFNEFYDMGYEMGDWNPMYRGADFTSYGNQIRFNFIHHLMETPNGYPVAGMRNDDFGHGLRIHHNIFYKTGRTAAEFNGAANSFTDNIVMDTQHIWWTTQEPYEVLDKSLWNTKGTYLTRKYQSYLDDQAKIAAGTMKASEKLNYLGRAEMIFGKEGWKNNSVWLEKYPIMKDLYNFMNPDKNPWMQCYDTLKNNYISNGSSFPFHVHGPNKVHDDKNIQIVRDWMPNSALIEMPVVTPATEIFEDFANMNLRIKSTFTGIPALNKFDIDKIGLFIDEYRKVVPNKQQYRMAVKEKYKNQSSTGGTFNYDLINKRYNAPDYLKNYTGIQTGLTEQKKLFDVRYAPGVVYIIPLGELKEPKIRIHAMSGALIVANTNPAFPFVLSRSDYSSGVFVVTLLDNKNTQTQKIILF